MPLRETYQKNAWDGGLQAWDMLMEIKYCGSSTVTMNKHSQNLMPTIFSSGCYAPYIYTIIAPLSQSSPAFDLLFYRSVRPFYTFVHCGISVCSCTWRWLPRPDSVPYNGPCKCFAREIEVIMHVRVRLCGNVCVSRRMRESWQLCHHGLYFGLYKLLLYVSIQISVWKRTTTMLKITHCKQVNK